MTFCSREDWTFGIQSLALGGGEMGFGDGQGQLKMADDEGEFEKYHGYVLQGGGSIGRTRPSHRKAAAVICFLNVAALLIYVLQGLRSSDSQTDVLMGSDPMDGLPSSSPVNSTLCIRRYTEREIERLNEAREARQAVEPVALIDRVNVLQLESLKDAATRNESQLQQAGVKSKETLDGGKLLLNGPEIEDGIIPGRPLPAECNAEPHTDYDGAAVRWGPTHPQESAADCCQACIDQARNAKKGDMKCNLWVFCPAEEGCFSPDIYVHREFECWLKQAETPRVNFKGHYPPDYRRDHPNCPQVVAWTAGVLL